MVQEDPYGLGMPCEIFIFSTSILMPAPEKHQAGKEYCAHLPTFYFPTGIIVPLTFDDSVLIIRQVFDFINLPIETGSISPISLPCTMLISALLLFLSF